MPIYIVAYDLHKPGQNYNDILKFIKKYPWAQLSESSYAIESSKSPETLFSEIGSILDENDNLFIITLSNPWWGQGPEDVIKWLKQKL